MNITYYKSPIGWIQIEEMNEHITFVDFVTKKRMSRPQHLSNIMRLCVQQFDEYFHGKRIQFSLPLHVAGTSFQTSVWKQLQTIPFGKTVSYKHIACAIHNPKAVRAVGQAIHRNPIAIIVPCHRVLGCNGAIVGYATGVSRKRWLLQHEKNASKVVVSLKADGSCAQ